jgi:hypothetical protein
MTSYVRHEPFQKYRIIERHRPTTATIRYTDDRASAVQHAIQVGGEVEVYVYGIGWQNINKVKEASEC